MSDTTVFWWFDKQCYRVEIAEAYQGYYGALVRDSQEIAELAAMAKEISSDTANALGLLPS